MDHDYHFKKKKIVLILQGGKGGTHEYLKYLLGHLNKEKYEMVAICHGEVYNDLKSKGYAVHAVNMVREISPVEDMMALVKILVYLRKNKPDLVYAHSTKAGVLGRVAAGILSIPNVYNPHGWSFNMKVSHWKKNIYMWVERIASLFADKIVAISEFEYDVAVQNRIAPKSKMVLIRNGVDLVRFRKKTDGDLKKRLGIPADHKVVGMVGRLTEQKAPQMFVEVCRRVTATYPKCTFVLVGDGELRGVVEKMISQYRLQDKLLLTGWVDHPEPYIAMMAIGVLTSQWEGFSLVLAEMMACGKPVVASNVDSIPYVVEDRINGILCDRDDVQGFVEGILALLQKPDLYQAMSEAAYQHARDKFDVARVIAQHEEMFDSL